MAAPIYRGSRAKFFSWTFCKQDFGPYPSDRELFYEIALIVVRLLSTTSADADADADADFVGYDHRRRHHHCRRRCRRRHCRHHCRHHHRCQSHQDMKSIEILKICKTS